MRLEKSMPITAKKKGVKSESVYDTFADAINIMNKLFQGQMVPTLGAIRKSRITQTTTAATLPRVKKP